MYFSKEYTSVYNRYCLKMFFSKLLGIHKENKQKKIFKAFRKTAIKTDTSK